MARATGHSGSMPAPRPEKGGRGGAVFWALIAMLAVGVAAFLLVIGPRTRAFLSDQASELVNETLRGTPLAGIGDILRHSPPPPPPMNRERHKEPGTLSGAEVNGILASPHAAPGPANPETTDAPVFSQELLPPATEDSKIRPDYLLEVAHWLADRYRPGPHGGTLAMSVQSLNQLGGVTLAGKTQGGRASLLRYVFQPSMIQGLYNLYINRFMDDLDTAARDKGFDASQRRQFRQTVAGRAALVASALESVIQTPDLGTRLARIDDLAAKMVEANAQLASAVLEMDNLNKNRGKEAQLKAARLRLAGAGSRYRRAAEEYAAAQRGLVTEIRKQGGPSLDEDSLLFLASWVARRLSGDSLGADSIKGCVSVLRDFARRCAEVKSHS